MASTRLLYSKGDLKSLDILSEMRLKNLGSGSISIDGDNPFYLAAYSIEEMITALSTAPLNNIVIGSKDTYLVKLGKWDSPEKRESGPVIGKSLPGFGLGKLVQRKYYGCFMLYFGGSKMSSGKDITIFTGRANDNRSFSDFAILAALREKAGSTTSGGWSDAALDVVSTVADAAT